MCHFYLPEEDYDDFCLAYMFTFRDFEGGTLGLAWTGDLKNAGGVCERNGVSWDDELWWFNVGVTGISLGGVLMARVSFDPVLISVYVIIQSDRSKLALRLMVFSEILQIAMMSM